MDSQIALIRRWIIEQPQAVLSMGYVELSFMLMAQGTETMGAFLDKKPFKAKGQSKERFALALKKLFPTRYSQLNSTDFLYRQLRNLTHLGISSRHLWLLNSGKNSQHLSVVENKTVLIAEDMMRDYLIAAEDLISMLESGKLKAKILAE